MDIRWKHPFAALVAGPSGSGKSFFIRELIERKHFDTEFHEIIWCYGEYQSLYAEIKDVTFHEGLLNELPSDGLPRLIVVDDLMREADERVVDIFTKGSHHRNVSVIFITQNLFHQKKGARDISLNSHYIVVFKNPRDAAQFSYLARQISPDNPKILQEAYNDATSVPHGYLVLDLKQNTKDVLRYRTKIFDEYVTIYVPKSIKGDKLQ